MYNDNMYDIELSTGCFVKSKNEQSSLWGRLMLMEERDAQREEYLATKREIAKLKRQILQEQLAALRENPARHHRHLFNGRAS